MHPYLINFHLFGHLIRIPTYGFFLALAFSSAYTLGLRRASKLGDDPKHIENLFLGILISSIAGSRLFHVFFEEPATYFAHPEKIIAVWEGGYTLYGGIIVAAIFVFFYCRAKKIPFLHFVDITAPATAFGIFLGRIGCFFAGCCWGKPTQCFLGVRFSDPESFANTQVPVHPTQLYEALGALAIFLYLEWRFRDRKYPGQIFFEGLILYAILRYGVEIFRGDDYRGLLLNGWLSYSQLVSIGVLAFAVWGIWKYRNPSTVRRKKAGRR